MNTKHHGSCLCGEIRFAIEGSFESFYLCHCEYCRKDTGSAYAANLFSTTANLKWTSGEGLITSYTLPSTRHAKSFCCICGSALPTTPMNGKLLVTPAGSLTSPVPIKATAHIFIASRAEWDNELEKVVVIEGSPA